MKDEDVTVGDILSSIFTIINMLNRMDEETSNIVFDNAFLFLERAIQDQTSPEPEIDKKMAIETKKLFQELLQYSQKTYKILNEK